VGSKLCSQVGAIRPVKVFAHSLSQKPLRLLPFKCERSGSAILGSGADVGRAAYLQSDLFEAGAQALGEIGHGFGLGLRREGFHTRPGAKRGGPLPRARHTLDAGARLARFRGGGS
jgi:hypothetical protein